MTESNELYFDIASLLSELGIQLVELQLSQGKGSTKASAVVYSASGTGIDECSKAHRLIQARLEAVLGSDDFVLETASPGISRTIRHAREYTIFSGRGVRIFTVDEETHEGLIVSSDGVSVVVHCAGEDRTIAIERIRKAKLDYSQEGR